MRLCLVCMGNICRSPMAEVVLRHKLDEAGFTDVIVESAGTGGWHVGEPADGRSRQELVEHGYHGSHHRAQQFGPEWFERFDVILALDEQNLFDLQRMSAGTFDDKLDLLRSYDRAASDNDRDVPDPYYGGPEGFEHVLKLVERAADGLVDNLLADG